MNETVPTTALDDEIRLLIVDDDPFVRESLREVLEHEGYVALEAGDGKTALETLDRQPIDLLLLDLELPRVSGLVVLQAIADRALDIPVVIISGKATVLDAVASMKLGAYDFVEKPLDAHLTLRTVRSCLERRSRRAAETRSLQAALGRYGMCGVSAPMQRVYDWIDRAARSRAKVLITGESGTGKEMVAASIHRLSDRAAQPFVPVNCAAIPETLIESELFGHTEGAFTGARRSQRGRIEQADGGTLFLDEIGDMSLMTQAKVLRAVETGEVRRLGSERTTHSDFRLISATHRDLLREVEAGNFRDDLYYRLSVITVRVPALRERREDIPDLVRWFVRKHADENGVSPKEVTAAALAALIDAPWPGNVRQLSNVIERLVVLGEGTVIDARDVRAALSHVVPDENTAAEAGLRAARERFERDFILSALITNEWRIQETAEALGINRSHLWRKMKTLSIEPGAG